MVIGPTPPGTYNYDIVCQEVPDEITLAVNISCCPNRCKGCHSPWLLEDKGEPMTEEMLDSLIGKYQSAITCFCFMGGDIEPFEIQRLASWIKKKYQARAVHRITWRTQITRDKAEDVSGVV